MKTSQLNIRISPDLRKQIEIERKNIEKSVGYRITLSEFVLKLISNGLRMKL